MRLRQSLRQRPFEQEAPEDVTILGLADHYHTGDVIELTANFEEETEFEHWHWYTREPGEQEWVTVPEHGDIHYIGEADLYRS